MSEKILYLDAPSGLSGDMLLAALCACGVDESLLQQQLAALELPGWHMQSCTVLKNGLAAHKIDFICAEEHSHRHLPLILGMIERAKLPPRAQALAVRAFTLLAEAEAEAHGCGVAEVHFHEVGAADAILDICGVALALDILDIKRVYCSPLPLSGGFVECAHGRIPVPAPATLNLLRGYNLYDSGLMGELITPTGAALLKAMDAVQQKPAFALHRVGLGAGNRDLPIANVLRALLGTILPLCDIAQDSAAQEEAPDDGDLPADIKRDEVDIITCNIDDSGGEALAHLLPLLLQAGALDACYIPLMMKKGRPAWQLQVIAPPALTRSLAALIFAESSDIGLRLRRESRLLLPRRNRRIHTAYGVINVKVCGNNIAPEYEDVAQAAAAAGLPFKEVYRQALCQAAKEDEA